jgi:hypothetical protein
LAVAVLALGVQVCDAILADRALFADGSHFFLSWRVAPSPWTVANDEQHPRLFVNALHQSAAMVARASGVTDLRWLRLLFGAGMFVVPLLILAAVVWLGARARDYRLALVMGAGAVAAVMPSQLFILEQSITTSALAWLLLSYQLLPLRWSWYDRALVAVAAITLLQSHEAALVLGPVLITFAIAVALHSPRRSDAARRAFGIGAVGLAAAVHVAWWMLTHPLPGVTSDFLRLKYLALPWELWIGIGRPTLYLLTVVPLAVLSVLPAVPAGIARHLRTITVWGSTIGAALVLAGAPEPWINPRAIAPLIQFDLRFLVPFVSALFMLLGGIWVLIGRDAPVGRHTALKVTLAVALLGAVNWQVANTRQWRQFIGAVNEALSEAPAGEIDPARVRERLARAGHANAWRMHWPWAWGQLSVASRNTPRIPTILVPTMHRQLFHVPRAQQRVLRLPWLNLVPGAPYRFDALTAACEAGRCGIEPAPQESTR